LRAEAVFVRVRRLLARVASPSFHLVHWSIQADHAHLIVEADHHRAISCAMANFNRALAKLVNRIAKRRGAALRERYHLRPLKTPREAHLTIRYVLNNGHKHRVSSLGVDPKSSGSMFDGWDSPSHLAASADATVRTPRTWLLRLGWRKHGLIRIGTG